MLKNIFAKASRALVSIYLSKDLVSVSKKVDGRISFIEEINVSSKFDWFDAIGKIVTHHKLQNSEVTVILSSDHYQSFAIEKPNVKENEILSVLPFIIKDLVSETLSDLVIDYYDMPSIKRNLSQITIVTMLKKEVINIREILSSNSLNLKNIITKPMALKGLLGNSIDPKILISREKNVLVLTLVKDGQLYFQQYLRGFSELLNKPINIDHLLRDALGLKLQRSLDYINSQLQIPSISYIYLAFDFEELDLLADQLSSYLTQNIKTYFHDNRYESLITRGALMIGSEK